MKKMQIIVLLVVFMAVCSIAYAHPPSDIVITFDSATKMLKAVIAHNVSNTENHFIKKVDVSLNGKEILTQQISRQDNLETQTAVYLIPDTKPSDTLSVEAYCNIIGKLEKEIKIQ